MYKDPEYKRHSDYFKSEGARGRIYNGRYFAMVALSNRPPRTPAERIMSMMKHGAPMRYLLIPGLILGLAGCNPFLPKPDTGAANAPGPGPDNDLPALVKRADTAYRNDDLKGAAAAYKILIKSRPDQALYRYRLANIYARGKRPAQAIALYREALDQDPAFAAAWYNLSIARLKQTARSLSGMLQNIDKDDPLYKRAEAMLRGIEALIKAD